MSQRGGGSGGGIVKALPDQFELNEALAVTMAKVMKMVMTMMIVMMQSLIESSTCVRKMQTSTSGLNIESNVERVNTYMSKLETYLQVLND